MFAPMFLRCVILILFCKKQKGLPVFLNNKLYKYKGAEMIRNVFEENKWRSQ